jgi:hypothetical protein
MNLETGVMGRKRTQPPIGDRLRRTQEHAGRGPAGSGLASRHGELLHLFARAAAALGYGQG